MITKQQIDTYFTDNSKEIRSYIDCTLKKTKLNEEIDYFFTEAYLYVLDRTQEIKDTDMLKKYISTFLYNNSRWAKSSIREVDKYNHKGKYIEYNPEILDEVDEEYEEPIEEDYEAINELFYQSLKTVSEKAVWEIYFIHRMTSHQKFGDFIGRSSSVGGKYINWLISSLEQFRLEYIKNNSQY